MESKKSKKEKVEQAKVDPFEEIEIEPLKDFRITFNQYDIIIKEGVSVAVPRMFLQNMVTEKVIKSLP